MAEKPLKSIRFPGSEDVYKLKPDWKNIDNKPFNTIRIIDTITRDQLTESEIEALVSSGELIAGMFMHVSDVALTMDDLMKNGFSVTMGSETSAFTTPEEVAEVAIEETDGLIIILDGIFISIGESLVDVPIEDGLTFTKKGLYMNAMVLTEMSVSITVPVRSEKLNIDCLPDHLQFGDFPTGGDTLTWAGNTDGRYVFSTDIEIMGQKTSVDVCHISNAVPPIDIMRDNKGMRLVVDGDVAEGDELHMFSEYREDGSAVIGLFIHIIPYDNYTISGENGDTTFFPYKGIYIMYANGASVNTSLTIPGFTEFPLFKPMDVKHLPESHRFGDLPTGGDTLTWDGNTYGKEPLDLTELMGGTYYKVSDSTPTMNDFTNGFTITVSEIETIVGDVSMLGELNGLIVGSDGIFCIVPYDNFETDIGDGTILKAPHKGIYYTSFDSNGTLIYISKLTINNYTEFPSVLPIGDKYLPDSIKNKPCFLIYIGADKYMYSDSDMTNVENRVTMKELEQMILSGVTIWAKKLPSGSSTIYHYYLVENASFTGTFYADCRINTDIYYTAEYTSTT